MNSMSVVVFILCPISRKKKWKMDGSTHPCVTEQCGGGVGRNMAEALWRLRGGNARLLTAIGDDSDGRYLADIAPGLLLDGCIVKNARTSMYSVLFDSKGECLLGLGDMDIHNQITTQMVDKHIETLEKAPLVVLDGNVPQSTMDYVLQLCHELNKPGENMNLITALLYLTQAGPVSAAPPFFGVRGNLPKLGAS
ncbi:Pseudouridine kinase [Papilio xuthus]|uniref:Pseudouridine kinase n=1 Tax=Papilio xuthus TaxID=66420 RepID=A0A194PQE0_PAPXU|nr:Pseudouridine kinase [Papilio xuthus]